MRTVAVGSKNPVKIEAVRHAFQRVWPKQSWEVFGIEVDSGVSPQPQSALESIKGATNRALRARIASDADYGVGLEGGVQPVGQDWFDCGWIVVVDRKGQKGIGSTAHIIVPPGMVAEIHKGRELGDVVDAVFGVANAKQNDGHFGLMTNNAITRTMGYSDGVVMALVRFLHPEIF